LQIDVDHWISKYNETRPHSGKYCYGKTPMQTFREAKHLVAEKTIPVAQSSNSATNLTYAV
ncbi:MAG: IS481 family transposase, partial [Alphaproteobacteria bacterium]